MRSGPERDMSGSEFEGACKDTVTGASFVSALMHKRLRPYRAVSACRGLNSYQQLSFRLIQGM